MKLFISHVENELKIDNVFGDDAQKVFRKFGNFHNVLKGISKISNHKIVETKVGGKGFNKPTKKTDDNKYVIQDENVKQIYDNGGDMAADEEDFYESLYEKALGGPANATGLDHAITELITFHENFLQGCLINIKENFVMQKSTPLLESNFFPFFKIDELIKLHEKLKADFQLLRICYKAIGKIFEDAKDSFLVYCKVTATIKQAMDFLSDQVTYNEATRNCVKKLQKNAKANWKSKSDKTIFELKDLLTLIGGHLMKYPMMLATILKFAEKEQKTEIKREVQKAKKVMENIVDHVNMYASDHNYIAAMNNYREEVRDMPVRSLAEFGVLIHDIPEEVKMKKKYENNNKFREFQLMNFENYIVALEMTVEEKYTGATTPFGNPIIEKENVKRFHSYYKIKQFQEFRVFETREKNKNHTLELNAYKEGSPTIDKDSSLVLGFKDSETLHDVSEKLQKLKKEEEERKNIEAGTNHIGHEAKLFKFMIDDSKDHGNHLVCRDCKKYLGTSNKYSFLFFLDS